MGELVNGLMFYFFNFIFGHVFFGEISEGAVWIFGCVLIFPGFVGLIVLFEDDVFELVFACV